MILTLLLSGQFLNITISIALIKRLGIVGVAIGTAVPHILLAVVVLPAYGARQVGMPLLDYFIEGYFRPVIAALFFVAGCIVARRFIDFVSFVEFFGAVAVISAFYVRMVFSRQSMKSFFQRVRIQPRTARQPKQRKGIGHAAKLSPHEQLATALGLVTLNPPF